MSGAARPSSDPATAPEARAVLSSGRGRVVALAIAVGSVLPIAILRYRGDALLAAWSAAQRADEWRTLWNWLALAGSPGWWLIASVVGFGIAAAANWPNTARWMGMLALAVLWAGLADIAVGGQSTGTATIGAVTCLLTLWQPRGWPLWAAFGIAVALGRLVALDATGSGLLMGAVLGSLGVLLLEYAWHHAQPDAPPVRGATLRS